jgi:hypothetical protein
VGLFAGRQKRSSRCCYEADKKKLPVALQHMRCAGMPSAFPGSLGPGVLPIDPLSPIAKA